MNIVHFNETQPIESHFSFFLSLCLKEILKKTTNGASVLGILGKPSSATTAAPPPPKRHCNATRRPQGQLRATVGDHRREAVGPTSRGGGSGPGLLHWSEDSKSTRVPNPPGFRVPFFVRCVKTTSQVVSAQGGFYLFIFFFQLIDLCCRIRFG